MSGTLRPPDTRLSADERWLQAAQLLANMSSCERKKVGCLLLTTDGRHFVGYNRLAYHSTACKCEDNNVTRGDVLHAEEVAIISAIHEGANLVNSEVVCSCSPCLHCAAIMSEVGVRRVVYGELYRNDDGLKFLQDAGIEVVRYEQNICDKS